MTRTPRHQGSLPQRLFREWQWLSSRPDVLEHVQSWPVAIRQIDSLNDLLTRCGFEGRRDDDDADAVLGQLVTLSRHEPLAARVVLQRLLPGMLSVANRRGASGRDGSDAALAELVGAMWLLIRSYPVQRRPHHVAANLLRDAEYEAFRRDARRARSRREVPVATLRDYPEQYTDPVNTWLEDPRRRLTEVLTTGSAAGLRHDDVELLQQLARGCTTRVVASHLGVTDRALRARRAGAMERLRRVVEAA